VHSLLTGMLILVKTILSIPITILWQKVLPIPIPILHLKSIANTDTNTVYCFYRQQHSFFSRSSINEVNKMTVDEKMAKSL